MRNALKGDHMFSNTIRGLVAGFIGGIFLGFFMQALSYPTPGGGSIPVMMLVAEIVHWDNPVAGWIWHLANSAFIGAIYGTMCGARIHTYRTALFWGTLYGVAWFIAGAMVLMSMFLGMVPFSFMTTGANQSAAIWTLIGHLVFGWVVATAYVWLSYPRTFTLRLYRGQKHHHHAPHMPTQQIES
jgi:hypothetical protein